LNLKKKKKIMREIKNKIISISERKDAFKQTEIGRIPKEWEVVRLCEIVKEDKFAIVDGPFGTQLHSNEYVDSGVPLIRVNNINKDGSFNFNELVYISEVKFKSLKRSAVYPGDILLAKTGATIGKVSIFPKEFEKGLIASSCAKISIDKNKADTIYIFYFLLSEFGYKQILALSTGATRPTINLTPISKITISLPPLPEQKKIAEILSTVDQAIEKVDEAIEKTERLKKGLMQELLTKGIGHKEFKDTEIGRIPKEWEVVKISNIADVKGGKRLPKGHNLVDFRTTYPYIRVVDFKNMSIDLANVKFLLPETYKAIKRYTISSNDVYISIAGSVGLAGLIPVELDGANLTENAAKLCNLRRVVKDYLAYILNSSLAQKQIHSFVGKAQQPKLALFRIEKIKIPLPPLPEQQKIAEILSFVDKRLELLRRKKEKLERVKKGLMNDLLTGRRRVKI